MFEYQNLKEYNFILFLNILNTWIPSCEYMKVKKKN